MTDRRDLSDEELASAMETVSELALDRDNEATRATFDEAARRIRNRGSDRRGGGGGLSWLERFVVFVGSVVASALLGVVVGAFFSLPAAAATGATLAAVAIEVSHARPELAQRVVHGAGGKGGSS